MAATRATATCGHSTKPGDVIGWNPQNQRTQCRSSWARWVNENEQARMAERYGI